MLVARDDPLDTYLVTHPEALLGRPVEATRLRPGQPLRPRARTCARPPQESPLTEADLPLFGPTAREVVDALTEAGLLRRRPRGWFWTDRRRASDLADIRSTGGPPVQLVESGTGRVVGTVDAALRARHGPRRARSTSTSARPGWSRSLDLEEHVAVIERAEPDYSTSAREVTDIRDPRRARARRRGGRAGCPSARSRWRTRWCPSSSAGCPSAR